MNQPYRTDDESELACGTAEGDVIARHPDARHHGDPHLDARGVGDSVIVTAPDARPDTDGLTERTRATWTTGDFGRIAVTYAASASEFVGRLAPTAGERVLDVACGTGNLTLPAARAGARVVGLDIAPDSVAQARAAADAERLAITFDVGDCEAMPYADGAFDTVMTMFGAMFAPHPDRAAAELLRVCRPGGRIAMANWNPEGFVGEMLRAVAAHVPPPPGVPSVLRWGDEALVRARLAGAASVACTRRQVLFELPFAPAAVVDYFATWYGPMVRAFAALDAPGRASLHAALETLWSAHNRATDGTTRVSSEYLEVVAVR